MNQTYFVSLHLCVFAIYLCECPTLFGQSVAEKKASLGEQPEEFDKETKAFLEKTNLLLNEKQAKLRLLYQEVYVLYLQHAPDNAYKTLLNQINALKNEISDLEQQWHARAAHQNIEQYALWHQPNTTIGQLVIDYGSHDYVYLVPAEVQEIPVSIDSNIPIPRASWDEMLELILAQSGVGMRQLNPYLRELYMLKEDRSHLKLITNKRKDIDLLPSRDRIAFVISPEPSEVRRVWLFLERFSNPNSTVLQMIGRDILIVASVSEVRELLKLYDFVATNRGEKEYKAVPLQRINSDDMAKVLGAIFEQLTEENAQEANTAPKGPFTPSSGNGGGLKVIALSHIARAVFLVGTKEEIRQAENIIRDVENQVGEAREKIIYRYTTRHSDPEELAEVLSRIYALMISAQPTLEPEEYPDEQAGAVIPPVETTPVPPVPTYEDPYTNGFYLDDRYVVNPGPYREPPGPINERDNFIVDLKSGSIVMVVEAVFLPQLKELIRKLDTPKKMVQLEVLLFEKRITRENDFGLQRLKVGDAASNTRSTSLIWNDPGIINLVPNFPFQNGLLAFLLSRPKSDNIPAYDLFYKFLLNREDIQINSSPSVLAVNQTPAVIEVVEEISVNTGTFAVKTDGGNTLENAFARARYGIKIEITPTIHMMEDAECGDLVEEDYVYLVTDVSFETVRPSASSRPDVTTRHILNEVRIPDGQTVILGGLRQKNKRDHKESIPFIGDIPGFGKFFSNTSLHDDSTEMFIFITPKIIVDPVFELERYRRFELSLRPGDIPGFLCRLERARECERNRALEGTLEMFLGRFPERCVHYRGEYDGR